MMLSIAILLGIAMVLNIAESNGNYNALMAAALVISIWSLNTPLAIVILIVLTLIGLNYYIKNK